MLPRCVHSCPSPHTVPHGTQTSCWLPPAGAELSPATHESACRSSGWLRRGSGDEGLRGRRQQLAAAHVEQGGDHQVCDAKQERDGAGDDGRALPLGQDRGIGRIRRSGCCWRGCEHVQRGCGGAGVRVGASPGARMRRMRTDACDLEPPSPAAASPHPHPRAQQACEQGMRNGCGGPPHLVWRAAEACCWQPMAPCPRTTPAPPPGAPGQPPAGQAVLPGCCVCMWQPAWACSAGPACSEAGCESGALAVNQTKLTLLPVNTCGLNVGGAGTAGVQGWPGDTSTACRRPGASNPQTGAAGMRLLSISIRVCHHPPFSIHGPQPKSICDDTVEPGPAGMAMLGHSPGED